MKTRRASADSSPPRTVKRTPPPSVRSAILRSSPTGALVPRRTPAPRNSVRRQPGRARSRTSPVAVPMSAARRTITTTCQNRRPPFATSEPDLLHRLLGPLDLAVALLVLLDVLRQGAAELFGDERRAEHAGEDLHLGAAGYDAAEVHEELRAVVRDAAEVHVNPLGHGIVDARPEGHVFGWILHRRAPCAAR